ncbi:alpha/beta hydrolase [Synoicihabitans lomoniglobus]|uniref:Alpha/beta hydrolase-fold protein n=1 Tax=Synoicihabitans lomoniglobus TaxID=2909285 RepID=A0AAF0I589_9BACT|nr:hypothetical protein [Opitutaceae bacterium LMO-M01]WED66915.1 alpha/beta hydrolase-fold protein [Opitutaceae bacterium LMO-M01]
MSIFLRPDQSDEPPFPAYTLARSEMRVLEPTAEGRHYQLMVGLPPSYAENSDRVYPVVYVTDGYWDFLKMTNAHGGLVYDKVVPEFIVVGLSYAGENLNYGQMRGWELSPVAMNGNPATGHADMFLATIKDVIIPFIESEYRADPSYRVMAGASLGGLFTLYAMYSEPELFQACIAATPAVVVGDDWLLKYEAQFAASGRPLPVRLFASGGGNESPTFLSGILRFNSRAANSDYAGFDYQFRIIDGERHAGMQIESYTRGLRFAFEPLAPETGPSQ